MTVQQLRQLLETVPGGAEVRIAEGVFDVPLLPNARLLDTSTGESTNAGPRIAESPFGPDRHVRLYLIGGTVTGHLPGDLFDWAVRTMEEEDER